MEFSPAIISLREFLPFLFLFGSLTALKEKENLKVTIKKCCPKVFFPDFNDTSAENDAVIEELFPWFPFTSLISSTTLEEIANLDSIKDLFQKANFEYGARPYCGSLEKEFGCFRQKYSEQFYLVLYPGQDIKLYISKKSSYHGEGHFKVENRDCGFSKIDPGENNTRGRESGDLLGNSLFNLHDLRTFPPEDFCLDNGPDGSFLVEYCPCKTVPCVRKCCGESELYDGANDRCVQNLTFGNWRPRFENGGLTKTYYLLPNRRPSTCANPVLVKTGELNSREKCGRQEEERSKFHFSSDGSLQVKNYDVPVEAYCGDHVIYDSVFLENNFLICQPDDHDDTVPKFRVYGIFFIIGGIILIVTVAISLQIPELKTSMYNKTIICHNVSLLLADFSRGLSLLLPHASHNVCGFLSLLKQCTLLGSVFWMSTLCWGVLMGIRYGKSSGEGIGSNRRFLKYAIYPCVAPVLIVCATAAMEFAPSIPPHYIRPGFDCYCGFNPDSISILIYLYGPMAAIILKSLALYLWAFIRMLKTPKRAGNNDKHVKKKRFVTFSKFFFSVVISWLLEIIGWILKVKDHFWYFPDFLSIFRAAFIFVILIWEKNILTSLMRRWRSCTNGIDKSRRNSATESDLSEVKRREKILMKQITQTFRISDDAGF